MGERVVVDASVALAYLMSEVGSQHARDAVVNWREAATELVVPSHFWLEVTNALVRRHAQPPAEVVADFVNLDELGLTTVEPDRPQLLLALDHMVRSRLTAYDAIYLALALSINGRLATLDRRLAAAAGDTGLLIGPGAPDRVSEGPATYAVDNERYTGWAHTAVVGEHIAELRRQILTPPHEPDRLPSRPG